MTVLETLQATQLPLLALVLVAAGLAKLTLRGPDRGVDGGLADRLRHHRGLATLVASAECGLGVAVLTVPEPAVRLAVAAWFAGATWIVDELRTRRPEDGCGCFGTLSSTRIGKRVIARPLLLTAAATAAIGAPPSGLGALERGAALQWPLLAGELGVLLALSPEVGVLLARRSRPPCELRAASLPETIRALHHSPAWREYAPILTEADPVEVWRELCWRFLVYPGQVERTEVEVVFAVSLAGERRPVVRVAMAETMPEAALNAALDATVATRAEVAV